MRNPAQPVLSVTAQRIWRSIETGGKKPTVLFGLTPGRGRERLDHAVFEQAVGQLFLRGMVRWNGKTSARVLERKP